jgi:hypothetical protein
VHLNQICDFDGLAKNDRGHIRKLSEIHS